MLIRDVRLRKDFAAAHVDNWERIRRVCVAYGIRVIFVLQPTSLYPQFERRSEQSMDRRLYANLLVYEEMRRNTTEFGRAHPELSVADFASAAPAEAFYDDAHLFDDAQEAVAQQLVPFVERELERMRSGQRKLPH